METSIDTDEALVLDVDMHFTQSINPATTRNPYNGLLGFVSVAGLINRVQCISTSNTNSKSISIDVSGLFKQNEGTPKRWELLLGQWGQTAIAHAIGVCRYYVGDGTLNNAIVTASNSVTVSASIDTSGILTLSTSVSFSYVILNVYF